jgi:hypothetical protein
MELVCRVWCDVFPHDWCSGDGRAARQCLDAADAQGDSVEAYRKIGECCGTYPKVKFCGAFPEVCESVYNGTMEKEGELTELELERAKAECDGYCSALEEKADFCPGLSTGAIIGITVAAVVVVGVVVGVLVFFFVVKKRMRPGNEPKKDEVSS